MIAQVLAAEGHTVTILDTDEENLRRLDDSKDITVLIGDGILEKDLRRAGVLNADVFVALDPSDTRNAMAAQKARHQFNIPKVVCYIDDPLCQEMYKTLGLMTISPAQVISDMVIEAIHR
jgi:trk system potassium uptake protein TrkA